MRHKKKLRVHFAIDRKEVAIIFFLYVAFFSLAAAAAVVFMLTGFKIAYIYAFYRRKLYQHCGRDQFALMLAFILMQR